MLYPTSTTQLGTVKENKQKKGLKIQETGPIKLSLDKLIWKNYSAG